MQHLPQVLSKQEIDHSQDYISSKHLLAHFQVLEAWLGSDSIVNLQYLNLDTCDSLNEASITDLISRMGNQLLGLNLGGHHKLLEYFWTNMIPKLKNIKYVFLVRCSRPCQFVVRFLIPG